VRGPTSLGLEKNDLAINREKLSLQDLYPLLEICRTKCLKRYDLYKVWEALKKKVGEKAVIDKGWASKKDLNRLTRTVNHYRHYSYELPSNALSYEDARRRITELVRRHLGHSHSLGKAQDLGLEIQVPLGGIGHNGPPAASPT
jgi:hypothetical protein